MHKLINCLTFLSLFLTLTFAGCEKDDLIDSLPTPIAKFVTQYYPGVGVSEYSFTNDSYHVKLKNGPGMTFNGSYDWISVNGYGEALPQVFLFDHLPPALYEYLQTGSLLGEVMSVDRTSRQYTVVLMYTTVYYNTDTGAITQGPQPKGS
ncbi:MAG: hypothetical protein K2O12_04110 [Muribaculaceae bacterium]|nr:hypothetical protein [Muribaculaceae bacterium]